LNKELQKDIMQLIHKLLAVPFALLVLSSCAKTKSTTAKCADDVICTMMFAAVTVTVTDNTGAAVTLDEMYTTRDDNGEKITLDQPDGGNNYTVLNDSYVKKLQNTQAAFHFIGIKDGKQVINEPYTISADCCHIKKVSGKSEIALP
jgi:hypothetical protein